MKKRARALMDLQAYAVKCGQVLEAPNQLITALAEGGEVDSHPDAVAYALAQGLPIVSFGLKESADPSGEQPSPPKRSRKPKAEG